MLVETQKMEAITHLVSEGNKDSIANLARGHSCYILAKNLTVFCPCAENLGQNSKMGSIVGQWKSQAWLLAGQPLPLPDDSLNSCSQSQRLQHFL